MGPEGENQGYNRRNQCMFGPFLVILPMELPFWSFLPVGNCLFWPFHPLETAFYCLSLLPAATAAATACCCCLLLLPASTACCYCLLLLPAAAGCYCRPLLLVATACCYSLPLFVLAVFQKGNVWFVSFVLFVFPHCGRASSSPFRPLLFVLDLTRQTREHK